MASIQLSMEEAAGDLPDVCAVCGAAAWRTVPGRSDVFPWAISLHLPLCKPHKGHLRLRQLFQVGLYFSFLLFVAAPLLIVWDSDQLLAREVRGENPLRAWLGLRIFPLFGAVLCLTCGTLYYFLCIKVVKGDADALVLGHVAPEFVRAVQRRRASQSAVNAAIEGVNAGPATVHVQAAAEGARLGPARFDPDTPPSLPAVEVPSIALPDTGEPNSVTIPLEAAASGSLPSICMVCGQAASDCYYAQLPSSGNFFAPITFYAPLCDSHHDYFGSAHRAVVLTLLFCFLGVCFFGIGLVTAIVTLNPLLNLVGLGAMGLGFAIFYERAALLRLVPSRSIHIVAQDEWSVVLTGVADAFVQAMVTRPVSAPLPAPSAATAGKLMDVPGTSSPALPLAADTILALESANTFARQCRQDYVGSDHLLFGLCLTIPSVAAFVLKTMGIEPALVRAALQHNVGPHDAATLPARLPLTPAVKRVLDNAAQEMNRMVEQVAPASTSQVVCRVGTEHILMALLDETDSEAVQTLLALDVDLDELRQSLRNPLARVAMHETAIRPAGM